MPVVATTKGRSEFSRRSHVRVTIEDVANLVRKFLFHAGEREAREAFGCFLVQFGIFLRQTEERERENQRDNLLHFAAL